MTEATDEKLIAAVDGLRSQMSMLKWLVGIIVGVMPCGVPWAYTMHGRTVAIETSVKNLDVLPTWFQRDVEKNSQRIEALESRLRELENGK